VLITGLTAGRTYYWRIRVNLANNMLLPSKWSASRTLTIGLTRPGEGAILNYPTPGAKNVEIRPTFQWSAVPSAVSYTLQLADNPFYANPIEKKPLTHTTWAWDEDLAFNTTYYWRVQGIGATGIAGAWAEGVFTTMAQPTPTTTTPPITITTQPPATITIPPSPGPTMIVPAYIWAIIIIGAILVIAVIVLIIRTRRPA